MHDTGQAGRLRRMHAGFHVSISGHVCMSHMPYHPYALQSVATTAPSDETTITALLLTSTPLPLRRRPHPCPSHPVSDATKASRLFQNKSKSVVLFQEEGFDPHLFIDTYFR